MKRLILTLSRVAPSAVSKGWGGAHCAPPWFLRVLGGCGFKFWWQPHILLRLTPDKRIYNFWIPRTTPTHGLKKWLFDGVCEVRKGPPLWKWSKIDQLFIFLAKWWIFLEPKVLHPLPHSKWGIVKKNWRVYMHIHARIRKYMTGGAHCAPPTLNRVKNKWPTDETSSQSYPKIVI